MKKYAYWIGIAIVLLLIVWGLSAVMPAPQEPVSDTTSLGMLAEPNAIFVNDQKPGEELMLTGVFFDPEGTGGFVALHRDDNSAPGVIIGVSLYLEPGEYQNVPVELSGSVANGDLIYAMLHQDDGDQIFDPQKDVPVESTVVSGPIMGTFTIDENAELPAAVMY